jgi:hypothetical protein
MEETRKPTYDELLVENAQLKERIVCLEATRSARIILIFLQTIWRAKRIAR